MQTTETIVVGGGCFWCIEAVFQKVRGVVDVVSGYAGGQVPQPTYEAVSSGTTGHAEVVALTFDTESITLSDILHIFFGVHDPTTVNQQGHDRGTQYRSIILYGNSEQKRVAEEVLQSLRHEHIYAAEIVTEVVPLQEFFPAEEYHQRYFMKHPEQAYCQAVIEPKLAKLRERYQSFYRSV